MSVNNYIDQFESGFETRAETRFDGWSETCLGNAQDLVRAKYIFLRFGYRSHSIFEIQNQGSCSTNLVLKKVKDKNEFRSQYYNMVLSRKVNVYTKASSSQIKNCNFFGGNGHFKTLYQNLSFHSWISFIRLALERKSFLGRREQVRHWANQLNYYMKVFCSFNS